MVCFVFHVRSSRLVVAAAVAAAAAVVVFLGFMTPLTSRVISGAFYSESEKSD